MTTVSDLIGLKANQKIILQHKELENYLIQPTGYYNPDLPVDEQTGCLPYDPKWEFPKDRLRLGTLVYLLYITSEAMYISKCKLDLFSR